MKIVNNTKKNKPETKLVYDIEVGTVFVASIYKHSNPAYFLRLSDINSILDINSLKIQHSYSVYNYKKLKSTLSIEPLISNTKVNFDF